MFLTPTDLKLSQSDINKIAEKLWQEEKDLRNCPDCGVEPGETHGDYCDISRCLNCGEQTIFEDCCDNIQHDVWTGHWPGIKECYEQKLICYDTASKSWCFDLNRWIIEGRKS